MRTQAEIGQAYDNGYFTRRMFSKNVTVNTTLGVAQDLSGVSGNPVAQYFLGASGVATELSYLNNDKGLDHGVSIPDAKKFLHKINFRTVTSALAPLTIEIYDYLMFYGFIGMDTGLQELTTNIELPRYGSEGAQIMVVEQNPYVGGVTFQVGYTNQDGVSGRLTPIVTTNSIASIGTIATSGPNLIGQSGDLLPLQQGDKNVQKIDTIEFFSGDVGTVCLCLVKPIATAAIFENTTECQYDFWFNFGYLPEIKNNAYLNMVIKPAANGTGAVTNTLFGQMTTIWKFND